MDLKNKEKETVLIILKERLDRIKTLVTVVAICFGIAFLDGIFTLNISGGFYILLGLVQLTCLIWLINILYKKGI